MVIGFPEREGWAEFHARFNELLLLFDGSEAFEDVVHNPLQLYLPVPSSEFLRDREEVGAPNRHAAGVVVRLVQRGGAGTHPEFAGVIVEVPRTPVPFRGTFLLGRSPGILLDAPEVERVRVEKDHDFRARPEPNCMHEKPP